MEAALPSHIVCLTFDFDTASSFVARGLTTPAALSRGEFGCVGGRRLLDLLDSRAITSTWFIPGFTIESFPAVCESILAQGHEIAHHSWAHISPHLQSREEEEADMVRAIESIVNLTGARPEGYRSPAWDYSENTLSLLVKHGFEYDSSLMGNDYQPYWARHNVAKLGEPLHIGERTGIIELPISWTLDDHPHFEFLRTPEFLMPGLQAPKPVMDCWFDEFTYMTRTCDWGLLTYTLHPYVIGRGYRMLAFEGFLDRLIAAGAEFRTMSQAAREAKIRLGASETQSE